MEEDRCSISLQSVASSWMLTPEDSIKSRFSTDSYAIIADSENEEDDDDDGNEDGKSISTASVDASLYEHEFEYGRRYHKYRSGRYPFPNDQQEQELEETMHAMMLEVTGGHIFYADVGEHPQNIIDIGTGLGTWATDAADMYPGADVIATDLSPIQSTWLPVNMRVFIEDCEDKEWLHGSDFDLAHLRNVAGTLKDLNGMVQRIHDNLKPGGWIEFQDLEPAIYYHETPSPSTPDSLSDFFQIATQGLHAHGYPSYPSLPPSIYSALSQASFSNIQIITKKIPLGTWSPDTSLHTAGFFAREAVSDLIESMAAKPLAALDLEVGERVGLLQAAKGALREEGWRRYVKMHFVFGQKKVGVEDDGIWVSSGGGETV